MSVIYDALKKVGEQIDKETPGKSKKQNTTLKKSVFLLIYICVTIAGFTAANMLFNTAGWGKRPEEIKQVSNKNYSIKKDNLPILTPEKTITINNKQDIQEKEQNAEMEEAKMPPPQPPSLVLNGLFFSGNEGYAIINNQIVREGDIIDGAQVKHISMSNVELDFQGQELNLANNK